MIKQAILCVDDEAIITLSIKQELKDHFEERFVYETAFSAKEALDIVGEFMAEEIELILVISDWLMPGMNGDEFLREVRKDHPRVKTILVTGHALPESLARMKEEGLTNVVLMKPWKASELIGTVESLVSAER